MELLYLRYKNERYMLVLKLGERDNKLCCILSSGITNDERSLIIKHKQYLSSISLERKIKWMKDHCPTVLKNNYREIKKENAKVLEKYDLTSS